MDVAKMEYLVEHAPKMELLEQLQLFQKIRDQIKFTQHSTGVLINLQRVPEAVLNDMYQTVKQYQEARPFLNSGQLHARSTAAPSETIVVNLQPSEQKEEKPKKIRKAKTEPKPETDGETKKRKKPQKI
jgi:hypothetical protein